MHENCELCGNSAALKFAENIDPSKYTPTTYGSRKSPELMHYSLYECKDCNFLFSESGPSATDLEKLYLGSEFDSPVEARHASETYWREIAKRGISISQVLDVGAGEGSFLGLCLENGAMLVEGIEPSASARSHAQNEIQEFIMLGTIESATPSGSFTLVTLFQTIEHLRDPLVFLAFAKASLIEGGTVALACHDYQHPVNRLLGKRSPIFDVEHLQLFSRKSVRRLLLKAGFRSVSVRRYWNRYPLSYLIKLSPLGERFDWLWRNPGSFLHRVVVPVMLGNLFATATK